MEIGESVELYAGANMQIWQKSYVLLSVLLLQLKKALKASDNSL